MKSTMLSAAGAMSGLEGLLQDLNAEGDNKPEVIEGADTTVEVNADAPASPEATADKPKKGKKASGKTRTSSKKAKKDTAAVQTETPPADTAPDAPAQDAPVQTEPTDTAPVDAAAPETPAQEEAPKRTPQPRVFFGRNKVGRMEHRLGADLGKFLVLDAADVELDDAALAAKHDETKALIKGMGVKVANRAANLIEFIGGKARLNPVIERALRLLSKDGQLVSGDKGNLHLNLLSKPYSVGAARAMGNNTLNMLKQLRLIEDMGKQTFAPNGESTLLALVSERLALSFADNEAAVAELEKQEADERAAREAAKQPVVEAKVEDNQETLAPIDPQPETPAEPEAPTIIVPPVEGTELLPALV